MSGKHEIITVQQDIKTREMRNLFRECHRKFGTEDILNFRNRAILLDKNAAWRGPCVFYGLFEWKKSVGHVLCKIVSHTTLELPLSPGALLAFKFHW